MEKQPTAILLLYTDYLNNRDSIAFFRLSSSFWAAHRSPQGRYRLKTTGDGDFLQPSHLPSHALSSPLFSPSRGFFSSSFVRLDDFSDFSSFFSPASQGGKTEEISTLFQSVKQLSISLEEIEKMIEDGRKIPRTLENIRFSGHWPSERVPFKRLSEFLPDGVKSLNFSESRQLSLTSEEFPDFSSFSSLEELSFWGRLKIPLQPGSRPFPQTLRILSFLNDFNQLIPDGILPDSLEELIFEDSRYDHPLPDPLPRNLKSLKLGHHYNQPIRPGQLPVGLKSFKLYSDSFNCPLELGIFPAGIEEIILDCPSFDEILLPGLFPDSLKTLDFRCSGYTNLLVDDLFPKSLEILLLFIDSHYSHPLPSLPAGLKSLFINHFYDSLKNPTFLPPRLEMIEFSSYNRPLPVGIFPASLKVIEFSFDYNEPLEMGIFPIGLKKIRFGRAFNFEFSIGIFPPSIEEIEFPYNSEFNHSISLGIFSVGLKKIIFGDSFDQELPVGIFPPGILTIELGNRYSHPLEVGLFPQSVRKLRISTAHPLPLGVFPEGVESIEFSPAFSQSLLPGIFPSSLRSLKFSASGFSGDFLPGVLPEFLCELDLSFSFCGYLPLSSLPPYFLDDFPSLYSDVPHRLKSSADCLKPFRPSLDRLRSRLGDRQFLLKTLRVSVSSSPLDYFLVEPLNGLGEAFVIFHRWVEKIPGPQNNEQAGKSKEINK